jgi:hypothetical protein
MPRGSETRFHAVFFAKGEQIKIKSLDWFRYQSIFIPKMKKSKFPALARATIAARTILNAATINPFSLVRVASKSKFLSVFGLLIAGSLLAAQARQVDIHDPAMAKEGDTYYLFSSGPGITFYSSKDMKNWDLRGRVVLGETSGQRF